MKNILLITLLSFASTQLFAEEMIIGTELLSSNVDLIFEGAPKDTVYPEKNYLAEAETDVHIEMLANWSQNNKYGAPAGGFVAYLDVTVKITNQKTTKTKETQLTPHLNLSDNFHYAQNIKLPGNTDALYTVTFTVNPPKAKDLGIHHDWYHSVGQLIAKSTFTYKNLSFDQVTKQVRRKP